MYKPRLQYKWQFVLSLEILLYSTLLACLNQDVIVDTCLIKGLHYLSV